MHEQRQAVDHQDLKNEEQKYQAEEVHVSVWLLIRSGRNEGPRTVEEGRHHNTEGRTSRKPHSDQALFSMKVLDERVTPSEVPSMEAKRRKILGEAHGECSSQKAA